MAVAYRSGTVTGSGPPFVPSEPASAAEGDFMLAFGLITSVDGVWSLPGDFTQIDQFSETTGANSHRVFIARKKRGADAGSGYSFGYDGTDANANVGLIAYSGNNLGLDVTYSRGSHYSTTNNALNTAAPAITTNTDGAMVVLAYMAGGGAIDSFGVPTNYNQHHASAGANNNLYLCDDIITTASTETPGAFNHTDAAGDQDQRTFTIAIAELSASKMVVLNRIRGF